MLLARKSEYAQVKYVICFNSCDKYVKRKNMVRGTFSVLICTPYNGLIEKYTPGIEGVEGKCCRMEKCMSARWNKIVECVIRGVVNEMCQNKI